jgi:hypothetical protein
MGGQMKVFLSWSGDTSKAIASALHDWLRFVFPEVIWWMSDRDIQAGQRWADELDRQLEATNFGILCLVPSRGFRRLLLRDLACTPQ